LEAQAGLRCHIAHSRRAALSSSNMDISVCDFNMDISVCADARHCLQLGPAQTA
jgi:hypothetical protein